MVDVGLAILDPLWAGLEPRAAPLPPLRESAQDRSDIEFVGAVFVHVTPTEPEIEAEP